MKTLRYYIDSLLEIWNGSSPPTRIGLILLVTTCSVAVLAVGYWSLKPNYVVLLTQQEAASIDEVANRLDKEGIEYQLTGAGGNLLVPQNYYARARSIARSIGVDPVETGSSVSSFMDAFMSPEEKRNLALLQKQNRLAATIQKIDSVEHADVHLSIPKSTPFARQRVAPSASVLLTLTPGQFLSDRQATSIANLVAFAVEGLTPDGVQVTDKSGQSYTVANSDSKHISSQMEYVAFAERKLADKAQKQLTQFLGPGNASVQVSMEMNFVKGSKTTISYDSEKVASEEDLVTETTSNSSGPNGAAGVASNLQTRRSNDSSSVVNKSETIKSSFLVPKTEETQSDSTPIRKYMTVSVLVNSAAEGIADGEGLVPPELKTQVEALVRNAVGFRDTVDSISVEFLPFPENLVVDTPVPFDWTNLNSSIEYGSLGVVAVLTFLLGLMLLRRIRPVPQEKEASQPIASGNLGELSKMVEQNPEVFARLIKLWSGDDNKSQDDVDVSTSRAA